MNVGQQFIDFMDLALGPGGMGFTVSVADTSDPTAIKWSATHPDSPGDEFIITITRKYAAGRTNHADIVETPERQAILTAPSPSLPKPGDQGHVWVRNSWRLITVTRVTPHDRPGRIPTVEVNDEWGFTHIVSPNEFRPKVK